MCTLNKKLAFGLNLLVLTSSDEIYKIITAFVLIDKVTLINIDFNPECIHSYFLQYLYAQSCLQSNLDQIHLLQELTIHVKVLSEKCVLSEP